MTDDEATIGRDLHARLLAGDPVASSDICRRYLVPLTQRLASQFRTTDPDLVNDAVVEALLSYIERPEQYDPTRKTLAGYLLMAARGDLMNLRERHRARREREKSLDLVEIDAARGNKGVTAGSDIGDEIADQEVAERLTAQAMAVATTEEERIVMRLRLDGERATEVYAQALGWDSLPPAEQRQRIYAIKDRLDKRLSRAKGAPDG